MNKSNGDIMKLALDLYPNYTQLTADRKEVFRGMLLFNGTSNILDESKQKDLAKVDTISSACYDLYILMFFEALDRSLDFSSVIEMAHANIKTVHCPREIVKFFHR